MSDNKPSPFPFGNRVIPSTAVTDEVRRVAPQPPEITDAEFRSLDAVKEEVENLKLGHKPDYPPAVWNAMLDTAMITLAKVRAP